MLLRFLLPPIWNLKQVSDIRALDGLGNVQGGREKDNVRQDKGPLFLWVRRNPGEL